jgi:hypothetical protein
MFALESFCTGIGLIIPCAFARFLNQFIHFTFDNG